MSDYPLLKNDFLCVDIYIWACVVVLCIALVLKVQHENTTIKIKLEDAQIGELHVCCILYEEDDVGSYFT
jgi:hypothetical protein